MFGSLFYDLNCNFIQNLILVMSPRQYKDVSMNTKLLKKANLFCLLATIERESVTVHFNIKVLHAYIILQNFS